MFLRDHSLEFSFPFIYSLAVSKLPSPREVRLRLPCYAQSEEPPFVGLGVFLHSYCRSYPRVPNVPPLELCPAATLFAPRLEQFASPPLVGPFGPFPSQQNAQCLFFFQFGFFLRPCRVFPPLKHSCPYAVRCRVSFKTRMANRSFSSRRREQAASSLWGCGLFSFFLATFPLLPSRYVPLSIACTPCFGVLPHFSLFVPPTPRGV